MTFCSSSTFDMAFGAIQKRNGAIVARIRESRQLLA
jgi:hypothetical protein